MWDLIIGLNGLFRFFTLDGFSSVLPQRNPVVHHLGGKGPSFVEILLVIFS